MAQDLVLLNDGTSKVLLNNGTDRVALNTTTADAIAATAAVVTGVIFAATIIYQDVAYTPFIPAAEVITVDKYARPFNEPVRRVTTRQQQDYISGPELPITTTLEYAWHRPLSEPTRRVTTRQKQELCFAGKPADPVYWFPRLSEPTRVKVRQNQGSFVYPYQTIVAATAGDDTARAFTVATQVRYDKTIIFDDLAYSPFVEVVAETVTLDKYFAPFLQPRVAKRIVGEGDYTASPTQPQANDGIGWHRPLSEPTRRKTFREGVAFVAPTQPQANDGIGWHRPFNEPTRRKVFLEGRVAYSSTQPQANDGIGWHRSFSEPTRRKVFLEGRTAYSPTLVEDAAIQAKWFQPFGVPRAAKRVPEFPAYSYSPYFVPPVSGTGTEFNWWPNVSERIRVRSPVTQQQAVIQGPQRPITVTLEYAWHRSLAEPVRRKRIGHDQLYGPYVQQEIVTLDKWFAEFGKPVRPRRITGEEGSLFFIGNDPAKFAWRQPFSEPARRKRNQALYGQAPFVYTQATGTGVGTDQPWPPFSEPVRFKRALPVRLQQYLVYYPFLINLELDPACRVIVSLGDEVIDASQRDASIASVDGVVIAANKPDSDITPDEHNNIVTVKC